MLKVDLNTDEITELFASAPIYEKTSTVVAEELTTDAWVETILADGYRETGNGGGVGDFIVTNPDGERYILPRKIFLTRYEATDNPSLWKSTGKSRAVLNPWGDDIEIVAPWGEVQYGRVDCLIAMALVEDETVLTDNRYIIDGEAFKNTYKLSE